jgi:hypothetical protein
VQEVRGVDVRADLAGRRRGLDHRVEHRDHALVDVRAQRLVRGIGRLQGRREPHLGRHQFGVALDPPHECRRGRVGGAQRRARVGAGVDLPPGTDVGTLDQAYQPPALLTPSQRRRPATDRAAA